MNVMLFMIITPPDSHIAKFAVGRLGKVLGEHVNLCIYFNGLPPRQQRGIRQLVQHNAHVQIRDNYAEISANSESIAAQVGKAVLTASGRASEMREGLYEPQAEIWSSELVRFKEFDLVAIVDPDLEIFEGNFIEVMREAFAADERLGFFSVDYSPSLECFDTYSREHCILEERYHTWFCMYRRRALELEHDFYFHQECGEKPRKWDHSAKLQETLRTRHGFSGSVLPREHSWKFLHYGAFAQNQSLAGSRLRVYRALRIGKHNGYIHAHKSPTLSRSIQRLSARAYVLLQMARYDREREHYIFESR